MENLLKKIRDCVDRDNYYITSHAFERMDKWSVSVEDVLFALRNGWHEEEKTEFEGKQQAWKYAIRGRSLEGFDLRDRATITFTVPEGKFDSSLEDFSLEVLE